MKKVLTIVAVALLAIIMSVTLFACSDTEQKAEGAKEITVIVNEQFYEVTTEAEFIDAVLLTLQSEEGLHYVASDGPYGAYITELGDMVASDSDFIAFYSTCDDIKYSWTATSKEYNGETFYSANYGADSMPVMDGITYLFVLEAIIY